MDAGRGLDRFARFTSRQEIRRLEKILEPEEDVLHMVEAQRDGRPGLLVCTRSRLLFVRRSVAAKPDVWGQESLTRIQVVPDGSEAQLILTTDEPATYSFVDRAKAEAFALAVKSLHSDKAFRPARAVASRAAVTPREPEPPTELERRLLRLEAMRKNGALTPDEFAYARRHILASLGLPDDLPAPRSKTPTSPTRRPLPPWLGEKRVARSQAAAPQGPPPTAWPGEERLATAKQRAASGAKKPDKPGARDPASPTDSKRHGSTRATKTTAPPERAAPLPTDAGTPDPVPARPSREPSEPRVAPATSAPVTFSRIAPKAATEGRKRPSDAGESPKANTPDRPAKSFKISKRRKT